MNETSKAQFMTVQSRANFEKSKGRFLQKRRRGQFMGHRRLLGNAMLMGYQPLNIVMGLCRDQIFCSVRMWTPTVAGASSNAHSSSWA